MMIHYPKKLIFSVFVCAAAMANAAVVPVDNAKQLAADFFSASGLERLAS